MKSTGIVRKIDDLGRMVIPIELRKTMNIDKKTPWKYMLMTKKSFSRSMNQPVFSVAVQIILSSSKVKEFALIV